MHSFTVKYSDPESTKHKHIKVTKDDLFDDSIEDLRHTLTPAGILTPDKMFLSRDYVGMHGQGFADILAQSPRQVTTSSRLLVQAVL